MKTRIIIKTNDPQEAEYIAKCLLTTHTIENYALHAQSYLMDYLELNIKKK